MANDKQNLNPYAGGQTGPEVSGRSSSRSPRAIPADDLHSPSQAHPMPREDISGYAAKGADTSAGREDSNQLGDTNTARGIKGATVDTGRFTDESSLQVPGDPSPYANETRTSAARRDADGC
jgi:hypothetical protein